MGTKPNCEILTIGPLSRINHLILAHGAGAPMTSPFLTTISELLNKHEITVHRFEFPYMREQRLSGGRRPPPRVEALIENYLRAIHTCINKLPSAARLFIGGKSMGGRVATLVAALPEIKKNIEGLVLLGYPFHPPKKPKSLRTEALRDCEMVTLIVQGTRDPFGTQQEVLGYRLPKSVKLLWIEGGNHDLKPPASSKHSHQDALHETAYAIAAFVETLPKRSPKKRSKRN